MGTRISVFDPRAIPRYAIGGRNRGQPAGVRDEGFEA